MNIRRDQRIQEGWLANCFYFCGRVSAHIIIRFCCVYIVGEAHNVHTN
jgi:hypothetical protein